MSSRPQFLILHTYLSTHRRHTFTFTGLASTLDTARHKLPPGRLHQLAGAFRVVFSLDRGILWWHHFCARACVEICFILQCCDCVTTCDRSDLGCEPLTIRREFRRCVLIEYHSADRCRACPLLPQGRLHYEDRIWGFFCLAQAF
jgi:hypothetical protein